MSEVKPEQHVWKLPALLLKLQGFASMLYLAEHLGVLGEKGRQRIN